jgi:type I restriction-modification system DNA methylase subunit
VRLIQPSLGELIQDPATGSGGFLVSADEYIRKNNSREKYKINPPQYQTLKSYLAAQGNHLTVMYLQKC